MLVQCVACSDTNGESKLGKADRGLRKNKIHITYIKTLAVQALKLLVIRKYRFEVFLLINPLFKRIHTLSHGVHVSFICSSTAKCMQAVMHLYVKMKPDCLRQNSLYLLMIIMYPSFVVHKYWKTMKIIKLIFLSCLHDCVVWCQKHAAINNT